MFANPSLVSLATTVLFVLLWSSGAIFSKWGLAHASPFALLICRSLLALPVMTLLVALLGYRLPRGRRAIVQAVLIGAILLGAYQICYLLALQFKLAPGVLATIMGVQPILTAVLTDRRANRSRLFGLALGLGGLVLVVFEGLGLGGASLAGMLCGLAALGSMTFGSMMQKRITVNPLGTLPVQYLAGTLVCAAFVPFQPLHADYSLGFYAPVLWLGLVVSVLATFLLYRLIAQGNLVNVTSLFYLVPAVTALLDWLIYGNRLPLLALVGMGLIVVGLVFVFRKR